MFFIDSWIWIEYFSKGKKSENAEAVIEMLKQDTGIISTFVLTETRYAITKKFGIHQANHFLQIINSIANLTILPLTPTVAVYAADLRSKYYSKKNQLSYGDAIHLSTSVLSDCKTFYTGDPDFLDIEEIEVRFV